MQHCAPVINESATQINFLRLANFWREPTLSECKRDSNADLPRDKEGILFPPPPPNSFSDNEVR